MLVNATEDALDVMCMSDGSVDGKLKMDTPRFEKHRRC
jgi:hypothetical protein